MSKYFNIEETMLSEEEFYNYVNNNSNIDMDFNEVVLNVLNLYRIEEE